MRAAWLLCLAALVEFAWGSSDFFHEEHSHETPEELQSRTFAAPKAPPPTEVTQLFTTRKDGKSSRPVVAPEVLAQRLRAKITPELSLRRQLVRLEKAMLRQKKQTSTISNEQSVAFVLVTLFMLALVGLSLLTFAEYRNSLPSGDKIFPPSVQPDGIPKAFENLLATQKTLVLLSDDCSSCLKGLKELKMRDEDTLAVLLTGHRLEQAVRTHLKIHYKIFQLPAIFINGGSFTDFAAAVSYIEKQ